MKDNSDKIIRTYSFGPGPLVFGPFLNKNYALNAPATKHPTMSFQLVACLASCPQTPLMDQFYNSYTNNRILYLGEEENSATGLADVFGAGGLRYPGAPDTPGKIFGWDPTGEYLEVLQATASLLQRSAAESSFISGVDPYSWLSPSANPF